MTPTQRTRARAFAIWRFASPRDWNVTYEEIGEATGLKVGQVQWSIHVMGWGGRIRAATMGANATEKRREAYNRGRPDLTQIFSNPRLTSAQEFGIDWG